MFLPDAKMADPALLDRGFPALTVKADRDHYLGRHLIACLSQSGPVDIIHGPLVQQGIYYYRNGLHEFGNSGSLRYKKPVQQLTNGFGFAARVRRKSDSNDGLFGDKYQSNWTAPDGIDVNFRATSNGMLFKVGSDETWFDDDSIPLGTWYWVFCSWKPGEFQRIYVNQNEAQYNSNAVASSHQISAAGESRIGTYYQEGGWDFDGSISHLFAFDRPIYKRDMAAIMQDPTQLIVPA